MVRLSTSWSTLLKEHTCPNSTLPLVFQKPRPCSEHSVLAIRAPCQRANVRFGLDTENTEPVGSGWILCLLSGSEKWGCFFPSNTVYKRRMPFFSMYFWMQGRQLNRSACPSSELIRSRPTMLNFAAVLFDISWQTCFLLPTWASHMA